jgi:hypothetical protein
MMSYQVTVLTKYFLTHDVVVWTSAKNNAKQHKTLGQTMNTALNSLSKWAMGNNMEITASKTVYQFFSMRHKNDNFDLKINSQKLPKLRVQNT